MEGRAGALQLVVDGLLVHRSRHLLATERVAVRRKYILSPLAAREDGGRQSARMTLTGGGRGQCWEQYAIAVPDQSTRLAVGGLGVAAAGECFLSSEV